MDLKEASPLARNVAKRRWFVVFICFLIMALAGGAYILRIYSESQSAQAILPNNQYVTAVHSGHASVSVFNAESAGGGGTHDSTQDSFTRAKNWVQELLKQGNPNLVMAIAGNKANMAAKRKVEPEVHGMIPAPQNTESKKNANKCLPFAKVESRTLMGRGLIDGHGEYLCPGQSKQFNKELFLQRNVGRRVVKDCRLLEATETTSDPHKPNPERGHGAHHFKRSVGTRVINDRRLLEATEAMSDPHKPNPERGHGAHHFKKNVDTRVVKGHKLLETTEATADPHKPNPERGHGAHHFKGNVDARVIKGHRLLKTTETTSGPHKPNPERGQGAHHH